VTYKNQAGLGLYLTGTITIMDGTNRLVVGDEDPVFIDKNQYKTITYDVELESDNISVQVYTLFGEGKRSLENVLEYQGVVELIEILDRAVLNITDVEYDASGKEFIVTVENVGEVDGYVSIELIDLYINGEYVTISSPEIVLIQAGNKVKIRIPAYLSDADRDNNPMIEVKIYYGERENSLIYTQSKQFPFKLKSIDYVTYGLILVIIALILLIIFGRKKCPHCGQRNSRTNKKCKKCGQPLYSEKRSIHDETGQRHHEHKE
jgi:archaellum component FlaF (FlaF/FlaG flagellin family)